MRSFHTRHTASRMIFPDIFDSPLSRSVKTMGISRSVNPARQARSLSSIWKAVPVRLDAVESDGFDDPATEGVEAARGVVDGHAGDRAGVPRTEQADHQPPQGPVHDRDAAAHVTGTYRDIRLVEGFDQRGQPLGGVRQVRVHLDQDVEVPLQPPLEPGHGTRRPDPACPAGAARSPARSVARGHRPGHRSRPESCHPPPGCGRRPPAPGSAARRAAGCRARCRWGRSRGRAGRGSWRALCSRTGNLRLGLRRCGDGGSAEHVGAGRGPQQLRGRDPDPLEGGEDQARFRSEDRDQQPGKQSPPECRSPPGPAGRRSRRSTRPQTPWSRPRSRCPTPGPGSDRRRRRRGAAS